MTRRLWSQHLAGATRAPAGQARATPPKARRPGTTALRGPCLTRADWERLDALVPDFQQLDIDLMGKPRMTRRDQWAKRPCVLRYRAQADHLRLAGLRLPMRYIAIAFLRMPDSWSTAEKRRRNAAPHLSKPDRDNLEKGLLDALAPSDAHFWDGRLQKRWGWHGRLLLMRAPFDEAALECLIAQHAPSEPTHGR